MDQIKQAEGEEEEIDLKIRKTPKRRAKKSEDAKQELKYDEKYDICIGQLIGYDVAVIEID
jgi:hypothetical protein